MQFLAVCYNLSVVKHCIQGKKMTTLNTYRAGADEGGHFGIYGGRYVAETLMPLILAVENAWNKAKNDPIKTMNIFFINFDCVKFLTNSIYTFLSFFLIKSPYLLVEQIRLLNRHLL